MRKGIAYISALVLSAVGYCDVEAQTNKYVREGNKLYEQKKYKEASLDYQKALQKNPNYTPGLFNLGNSLYQQKQYDAARKVMSSTVKTTQDKGAKAGVHYNIGNTYMQEQKWEDAISAYKHALRNNPQDADAKYNLSYAEEMLKKQQQQNQNNKDKNKQNKDQQDKDKDKDKDKQDQKKDPNKDQQDKGDPDKEKQDNKDQQQPQSQPSKLSQQQADQLLNALQQEEKKLQDKMQKAKGVPVKTEKDW